MQLSRRDAVDVLRSIGGILFASGAVALLIRKSGHHGWSEFARMLVVLVPAATLYVLALGAPWRPRGEEARRWQSVLAVVAILLWPVALLAFLQWVGANTSQPLYAAGAFALTAVLAGYATGRARASYTALLAGLASVVAWLLVWAKILDHASADTYRWLLVAAAALLLAAGGRLWRARTIGASEVTVAGGIAAVAAGLLGVIVGSFVGLFRSILPASVGHPLSNPLVTTTGLQHFGWDLYLLIASLALVWIGSRGQIRGLGYVGGIGLLGFILSIGEQVTRIESGRAPSTAIVGWPLALLIIGVAGLFAPVRDPQDRS